MKSAVRKHDPAAARTAFARAVALARRAGRQETARLATAIGTCLERARKQPEVLMAGLRALGEIKHPGSGRLLDRWLAPPRKLPEQKTRPYVLAIETAAKLHEEVSLKRLEKLVQHPSTALAVAATKALGRYRGLEQRRRIQLVARLVRSLKGFEQRLRKSKSRDERVHVQRVAAYLRGCLEALTGHQTATTSSDWTRWLKEAKSARPGRGAP